MRSQHTDPYWAAQDILSRRDHAEAEVRQKMRRKGFAAEDIDTIIQRLVRENLIDDCRFASAYIESILRQKPVGPRWLSAKLRQKGVASSDIDTALTASYRPSEAHYAKEAAAAWRRLHPQKKDDKAKLARHLAARGFSSSVIQNLL